MNTPICPKCGTQARVVVVFKAKVRCKLNADGTFGKVLSASKTAGSVLGYECGGGHAWLCEEAQR
jgi:hypothetical protein